MRSKLLGLIFGLGVVAATLAPAAACMYNNTTADGSQASPPQTAQTDSQAPAQGGSD
jgi:hypothetical protein